MDHAARVKIEKRAYELFMARGGLHGYHFEDWVKAEKEVMGAPAPAAKAAAPAASAPKQAKKKGK
jgi:ribosomal protein L12E/L44/L45/RPP1/RPP2